MHDPLAAIRRLYEVPDGDPGTEPATHDAQQPDSPDVAAELRALADLKTALDRLPPRRPDPSAIDAVLAAAEAVSESLDAVRRAYDDAPLAADADAETHAFAELRAALDALPPCRPDAHVLDAVFAAANEQAEATPADAPPEEDRLAPLRSVYEEASVPLASAAAQHEAAVIADLKAGLDALPPRRPDPSVVEAVLAAASPSGEIEEERAPAAAAVDRAADRPARRGSTTARHRVASMLGTAFALLVVFGGGYWLMQDAPTSEAPLASEQDVVEEPVADATPAAESRGESATAPASAGIAAGEAPTAGASQDAPAAAASVAAPPVVTDQVAADLGRGQAPASRSTPSAAGPPAEAATPPEALLEASAFAADDAVAVLTASGLSPAAVEALAREDDDALRLLYLRVRAMQAAQAGIAWDEPPVALGAAPDSSVLPSGWMQVRVDR